MSGERLNIATEIKKRNWWDYSSIEMRPSALLEIKKPERWMLHQRIAVRHGRG